MNPDSYKQLKQNIREALIKSRLHEMLKCTRALCVDLEDNELISENESIENDYNMMLHFMEQGGNDPQKHEMYRKFFLRGVNLTFRICRKALSKNTTGYMAELLRSIPDSTAQDALKYLETLVRNQALVEDYQSDNSYGEARKKLYASLYSSAQDTFRHFVVSDLFSLEDNRKAIRLLENLPDTLVRMQLQALYLNMLEAIDLNKFKIIFHFVKNGSSKVRAQALVCLLILYWKHHAEIQTEWSFYKELMDMRQDKWIATGIIQIQKQLYMSQDTQRATQLLNKEILPQMMKLDMKDLQNLEQNMGMGLEGLLGGNMGNNMEKHMKRITQMTQSGYDMNYSLFTTVCRSPFFNQVENWFCPFDPNHPAIAEITGKPQHKDLIQNLHQATRMCELDKYAWIYLLGHMPDFMRGAMADGITPATAETGQLSEDESLISDIRTCIQDMYRFATCCYKAKNIFNPFDEVPFFGSEPSMMKIVCKEDFMEELTRFFMSMKMYEQAKECLETLLQSHSANSWILHSLALCLMHEENYIRALQYEQQAELLEPDSVEILKSIQHLCLQLDKHEMRIGYLRRLEEMNAFDEQLEMGLISSLIETGSCEEALKRCYKLEYLEQQVEFARRSIAWCSLLTGNLEQAEKYYNKLLDTPSVVWADYLNAGHTAWLKGHISLAIGYYRNFIRCFNKTEDTSKVYWLDAFEQDEHILTGHGIDPVDISLLKDIIGE